MMKALTFLFALMLFACNPLTKLPKNPSSSTLSQDIIILSADDMKGREVGTPGETKAAEYIAKRYKELGLTQVKGLKGFFQEFRAVENDPHHNTAEHPIDPIPIVGKNVVGMIDNNKANTIIVGAHYDHLGMGSFGSLYDGPIAIHNGADDNASGVAVILYLAEQLQKAEFGNNNYVFVAFSGEEKGLWGSNYFVKNAPFDLSQVNYMFNYDMVGRMEDKKLAVYGTGTSSAWSNLDKVNKNFELIKSESGVGPSDHTSFYLADIPVLHFFTGQHEDYHRPSDDADKINFKGCYEIGNLTLQLINDLDDDGKVDFIKTKDESTDTPDFKVTLGVIPDYLFSGEGMRIDGVKEGRPAANAGIEKGDIVIKMGDIEVKNMTNYMEALGAFEKGEETKVVVKRNGKNLTKSVTF